MSSAIQHSIELKRVSLQVKFCQIYLSKLIIERFGGPWGSHFGYELKTINSDN